MRWGKHLKSFQQGWQDGSNRERQLLPHLITVGENQLPPALFSKPLMCSIAHICMDTCAYMHTHIHTQCREKKKLQKKSSQQFGMALPMWLMAWNLLGQHQAYMAGLLHGYLSPEAPTRTPGSYIDSVMSPLTALDRAETHEAWPRGQPPQE